MLRWRSNFPYKEPRQIQAETLQLLEDRWNDFDVFVIRAPTAYGKSSVAKTLINSLHSVSVITPTNLLVDQFLDEFPDTPTLSRLDAYTCEEWMRPCSVTRAKLGKFCKGCQCGGDLARAKYKRGPGIYNYHTYLAHKLYRDVLVVDEAHNLLPVIRDRLALRLWQHDFRYPDGMRSIEQMREWISSLPKERVRKSKKLLAFHDAVMYPAPQYMPQRTKELFSGKGTIRGEPEERDCIRLLPVDITDAPPVFWPSEVDKVVLLSATISHKDVEQLGLAGGRRRVCYIDCKSPIPAENRPIVTEPLISVSRSNIEEAAQLLAEYIDGAAQYHGGEKGVVHATYQMAALLSKYLTGPRYLFHDRTNKHEQYQSFRDSDPAEGRVLVACGMYEGIDLPEDLGRWQVISKVPWPSLGSPAVAYLADRDPEWYLWETAKTVIQACGRICRTPTDYGISYVPDQSFGRLLEQSGELIPEWFVEAIDLPT